MITVSLEQFIRTGKFGPIELGMRIEEVIELLGEPSFESNPDLAPGHGIIVYAWYEFFYYTDTRILYAIQNDHLATFPNIKTGRVNNKKDICFTNDQFTVDIWFLKKYRYLTFREVVERLTKEGVTFTETSQYDMPVLLVKDGVSIDFNNLDGTAIYYPDTKTWEYPAPIDNKEDFVLNGIRYFSI